MIYNITDLDADNHDKNDYHDYMQYPRDLRGGGCMLRPTSGVDDEEREQELLEWVLDELGGVGSQGLRISLPVSSLSLTGATLLKDTQSHRSRKASRSQAVY